MQSRRARAITAASRALRQNAACGQWLPPLPRTSGKARRTYKVAAFGQYCRFPTRNGKARRLRTKTAFRQNRRRFPVSSLRETARRGARTILPPLPPRGHGKALAHNRASLSVIRQGRLSVWGYVRRSGNRAAQNRPHSNRTAQRQVNATMRQHSSNAARQQVRAAAAQRSDNSAQQ